MSEEFERVLSEGLQILVVDSNFDGRQLLAAVLELEAVKAFQATSIQEASACLEKLVPDAIVSEVVFPGEDGYLLMAQVRNHINPLVRQVPVIAFTSAARQRDREKALAAGFAWHLSKPASVDDLLRSIKAVVEGKQACKIQGVKINPPLEG